MKWKKMGIVYCPDGSIPWARTHAMVPTPLQLDNGLLRLFVAFLDDEGIGRVGYVDIAAENALEVVDVSCSPVLDIGNPGSFDDNGVLPACAVDCGDEQRLYYIGFQIGVNVRYFMFSGLAVSGDQGLTFIRHSRVPVLDRSDEDLFARTAPFVIHDGIWKMWYVGGDRWSDVKGKSLPVYRIKYIESQDGLTWPKSGMVCFDFADEDEHGFGRPFIIQEDGLYKMFYSIRRRSAGYRLGYAESFDGKCWQRKDDEIGIDVSDEGWDSQAICYSSIARVRERTYMFYNGNNFGECGFGAAVIEDS